MYRFVFWQRWLLAVGLLTVLFGVVMALLNGTAAFDVFNQQIDPVFWGVEGPSDASALFQRWAYGAWGATLAGLGILIVFTVQFPFRRQETWARDCLVLGLVVWYVLDTGISLFFGVYFNAIFNSLLLVFFAIPLGFTWSAFTGKKGLGEGQPD